MARSKPDQRAKTSPEPAAQPGFSVLLLAAGRATRFKSEHSKVLHPLAGKPLGAYLLDTVFAARPERTYVVIGYEAIAVRQALERPGVTFIVQMQQLGTGHAVRVARGEIEKCPSPALIVLVGDAPLLRPETLRGLAGAHERARAAATILTTQLDDPTGYGRVVRSPGSKQPGGRSGRVRAVVEERMCTPAQRQVREISSGIICFSRVELLAHIDQLSNENAQREYLLTDLVEILSRRGERIETFAVADAREVLGVNDRVELAGLERLLRRRKAEALMRSGVTLVDPATTYIDDQVEVGADTIIEPGVSLFGRTRVGRGAHLGPWATVIDSVLGDRVQVRQSSVVARSELAPDSIAGPFAHVRDGTVIDEGAHIGNFVEVKKSRVGRGAKALHLTYLGDATLEDKVNIGAGTVTCNYDGVHKHPTVIEQGVFIGSGSMLVAPVRIGADSYVAAGSTITDDVPPASLALGRARQVNKEGWVREREARAIETPSVPPADETRQPDGGHAVEPGKKRREPEFIVRQAGTVMVIEATEEFGRSGGAKELGQVVRQVVAAGRKQIVVNLGRVTSLDSAAVGELVAMVSASQREGGKVKLCDLGRETRHILEAANLHHFFDLVENEGEAVEAFGRELVP
ncbi:MAG TPA: bifunctional UDP-N-acetylglucosamine diphosphorylase/glucosamine-1-phosphate N-acetyltransferase GlmU [Terriglobia bacterium]|nr:bifunctional UDP-N-acetylglucosamine diphosphorylase/glucosamine-1-phosphate N-acetyltransferase GlmU [Terriglobia bacterium]